MNYSEQTQLEAFMREVEANNPNEPEFHQSVREVAETIVPYMEKHPVYREANIFKLMVEPERIIIFRVPWVDDRGNTRVNRGIRVQFNSAIGPYKGGLRFHPTVNLSILKFLGFEQVLKNALTTLPLGGAKGGSDFDPTGKSDNEVMRFCQSFMTELFRHINKYTDVPAGDIGVGKREIGYLFGQYKRLTNEFTGIITGKDLNWGGSFIRPESTGYGTVYFVDEILKREGDGLEGKTVAVSGAGNVAQYAIEKAMQFNAKVLTVSDSSGCLLIPGGFTEDHLSYLKDLKNVRRGRVAEMAGAFSDVEYFENKHCWTLPDHVDIALPCATQNELDHGDAKCLIEKGVKIVAEGANMPCTTEAVNEFRAQGVIFAPGKAANAGGVATSGLEMAQNALRLSWKREKVDDMLLAIMKDVHEQCVEFGSDENGKVDYIKGANLAGFVKVADAMLDQGVV